ncbi:hypothetical protein [Nitriliruptor alkaliphilus]|uniref:hypothetical protein n=1 Tax=Nitriliruptor alkaliphilus TaxID=427918 RepID=UPI0012EE4426|nr:hypothetical protein [Nitriliruptor alkaliphilus]
MNIGKPRRIITVEPVPDQVEPLPTEPAPAEPTPEEPVPANVTAGAVATVADG